MREHGSVLGDVLGRHSKLVLCQAGNLALKPTKAGTGLLPVRRFDVRAPVAKATGAACIPWLDAMWSNACSSGEEQAFGSEMTVNVTGVVFGRYIHRMVFRMQHAWNCAACC